MIDETIKLMSDKQFDNYIELIAYDTHSYAEVCAKIDKITKIKIWLIVSLWLISQSLLIYFYLKY